jgi:hypothetical protein
MKNQKHTSGPWTNEGVEITAHDGALVICTIDRDGNEDKGADANAALIAAAPQLLEAMKMLRALLERNDQSSPSYMMALVQALNAELIARNLAEGN